MNLKGVGLSPTVCWDWPSRISPVTSPLTRQQGALRGCGLAETHTGLMQGLLQPGEWGWCAPPTPALLPLLCIGRRQGRPRTGFHVHLALTTGGRGCQRVYFRGGGRVLLRGAWASPAGSGCSGDTGCPGGAVLCVCLTPALISGKCVYRFMFLDQNPCVNSQTKQRLRKAGLNVHPLPSFCFLLSPF